MLLPLRFQNLGPISGAPPATPAVAKKTQLGYKVTASQLAQIHRDDEEIIMLITILGEHL